MIRKIDLYPVIPTKKMIIDSTIQNLTDFSISQKINYRILKLFNPWLRANKLTNPEKKKYIFEVPKDGVKIYDNDGNYNGLNSLTSNDSTKLITLSINEKDSICKKNSSTK
jgi:hypothetical protein